MHCTPLERTAATAGDHIDWITTSPEAIRLTDSSKVFQKARNWPSFLVLIRKSMVLSISALVMLPLSTYLVMPADSQIIAASMMPIDGMFRIEVLPLNLGSRMSFHWVIGRPTRSGRMPSVSEIGRAHV